MKIICGQDMRRSLFKQIRVYLCGNLSNPEDFDFIKTDGLEIGISHYKNFTAEKVHMHKWNNEYNFVVSGSVKVYNLNEQKEYEFMKDDMYVIEPYTVYVTKAKPNTEVIFIKSPGGNDKQLMPLTDTIKSWSLNWDAKMGNIETINKTGLE